MALKAKINSDEYESLGEVLQAEYRQSGDGYQLDVTPVGGLTLENTEGLKRSVSELKAKADRRKAALAQFVNSEGEALDAEDVLAKLARLEALEKSGGDDDEKRKAAWSQKEQALTEAHQRELRKERERGDSLSSQLDGFILETPATAALASEKANVKVMLPHVLKHLRVEEADGRRSVVVVDEEGNVRYSVTPEGKTVKMGAAELVAELKGQKDFKPNFEGTRAKGSGSGGDDGDAGGDSGSGLDPMKTTPGKLWDKAFQK